MGLLKLQTLIKKVLWCYLPAVQCPAHQCLANKDQKKNRHFLLQQLAEESLLPHLGRSAVYMLAKWIAFWHVAV